MGMSDESIPLFDDFRLDLTRGFLVRGDELVHLRPQTYEVLKYLGDS
jgi:DNA-binding winged helix-turn-helix (wHTH) protein